MNKNYKCNFLSLIIIIFMFSASSYIFSIESKIDYTIKKGDTLWAISNDLLGDPYKWKILWDLMPENERGNNPNVINVGDKITIVTDENNNPKRILINAKEEVITENDKIDENIKKIKEEKIIQKKINPIKKKEQKPINTLDAEEKAYNAKLEEIEKEKQASNKQAEITEKPPSYQYNNVLKSFITKEKYLAAGKIISLEKPSIMISTNDKLYVNFIEPDNVIIGDQYFLVRKEGDIIHPISKKFMGYKIVKTGIIKLLKKNNDLFTAIVVQAFKEIDTHDRIIDFKKPSKTINTSYMKTKVEGYVIGSPEDKFLSGSHDLVYLDLGSENQVIEGNVFDILKDYADPISQERLQRKIGTLAVFEVFEKSSIAMVLNASESVMKGQVVKSINK
ncbi:MAG: LysM domain-containing protein [Pseudomonadota bacterium]